MGTSEVTPLAASYQNGSSGDPVFGVDPNANASDIDVNGKFNISYSVMPNFAGVSISIDVPSPVIPASGQLIWREVIEPDSQDAVITVPEPIACDVALSSSCGQPQLPDLTPIVSATGLGPVATARLIVPDDAPASAGLFPAESWFIDRTEDRKLLRFATVAANIGEGPLDIIAGPSDADGTAQTVQRIWTDSWTFHDSISGRFVAHPTHDHIHFDSFERYRLLDESGAIVASSEKVSFCLRDSVLIAEDPPSTTGVVFTDVGSTCGEQQQAISPGFGDHYHSMLDDQWVDVTDVPPGDYTLEISVDPLNLIVESDESNNTGTVSVTVD